MNYPLEEIEATNDWKINISDPMNCQWNEAAQLNRAISRCLALGCSISYVNPLNYRIEFFNL
jgi:hypothetical protein